MQLPRLCCTAALSPVRACSLAHAPALPALQLWLPCTPASILKFLLLLTMSLPLGTV